MPNKKTRKRAVDTGFEEILSSDYRASHFKKQLAQKNVEHVNIEYILKDHPETKIRLKQAEQEKEILEQPTEYIDAIINARYRYSDKWCIPIAFILSLVA